MKLWRSQFSWFSLFPISFHSMKLNIFWWNWWARRSRGISTLNIFPFYNLYLWITKNILLRPQSQLQPRDYSTDVDEKFEAAKKVRALALKFVKETLERRTGNRSWMPVKTMAKEVPLKCRRDGCHNRTLCLKCQKHWQNVLNRFSRGGEDYYCPVYLDILDRCS